MLVPGNRYAMPSGRTAVFVREISRTREFKFRYLGDKSGQEGGILSLSREFVRRMLREDGIIWVPPATDCAGPDGAVIGVVCAPKIESVGL